MSELIPNPVRYFHQVGVNVNKSKRKANRKYLLTHLLCSLKPGVALGLRAVPDFHEPFNSNTPITDYLLPITSYQFT